MADPKAPEMCGECGCIHRPGENTLCPGWRPGPFVPDPKAPEMAEVLVGELPPGWRALAGGFASGDVLLVLTGDGLHRVKAREFGHGFAIEKTPLPVLRALLSAHGLHIVTEADKRVLDECAKAEIGPACHRGMQCCAQFKGNGERYVCTAELARRTP